MECTTSNDLRGFPGYSTTDSGFSEFDSRPNQCLVELVRWQSDCDDRIRGRDWLPTRQHQLRRAILQPDEYHEPPKSSGAVYNSANHTCGFPSMGRWGSEDASSSDRGHLKKIFDLNYSWSRLVLCVRFPNVFSRFYGTSPESRNAI